MHGGKTPKGADSPHFKHGKATKAGPVLNLAEMEAAALADPFVFQYRQDAALLVAMRQNISLRLDPEKPIPAAKQKQLLDITAELRKVKESEQRRLQQLALMVSLEQHRRAMTTAADIVVRVLKEASDAIHQAAGRGATLDQVLAMVDPMQWQMRMRDEMRLVQARTPAIVIEAQTAG